MNEQYRIDKARERAAMWLRSIDAPGSPPGVKRSSASHDPAAYPGMRLPATYNAWHCLILLHAADQPRVSTAEVGGFINSYQGEDGFYRVPEMREPDVFKRDDLKYTWEYINFHVTNYAFGAVDSLGFEPAPLKFVEEYTTPAGFRAWKDRRFWDDPWMEGNSVVNLASFLHYSARRGDEQAATALTRLLDYSDELQNPKTGYWDADLPDTHDRALVGMAGAAHHFHVYLEEGRPIRHVKRIIDSSLDVATGRLEGITSACVDIDIVDILANFSRSGYRRSDILDYLARKLDALLSYQNADGGFCDERLGTRTFDGWPHGYREPQGISSCFATWFRMATIAMISTTLFSETAARWMFRRTLGMGYFPTDEGAAARAVGA